MEDKADKTKFTIQFSRTDPSHLQAVDVLNRQGRRSKAQYIVNAIMHFENCTETPSVPRTSDFDIRVIEAVVNRLLLEKEAVAVRPDTVSSVEKSKVIPPSKDADEISYDEAVDTLGESGIQTIANTLDLFRKTQPSPDRPITNMRTFSPV